MPAAEITKIIHTHKSWVNSLFYFSVKWTHLQNDDHFDPSYTTSTYLSRRYLANRFKYDSFESDPDVSHCSIESPGHRTPHSGTGPPSATLDWDTQTNHLLPVGLGRWLTACLPLVRTGWGTRCAAPEKSQTSASKRLKEQIRWRWGQSSGIIYGGEELTRR